MPGNPIVLDPQPQEIQERVEQITAVRLGRRAVVVAIFGEVFGDGLEHQGQPGRGIAQRDLAGGQIPGQTRRFAVGSFIFRQLTQPNLGPLMQDGAQIGEIQESLGEQVRAIRLDESRQRFPFALAGDTLERRQTQRAAVSEPLLQKGFGQSFETFDQFPIRGRSIVLVRPCFRHFNQGSDQRSVTGGE